MIKLLYSNHRNIGNIYFDSGWEGILYLDAIPKASDIKYISEVEEKNGLEIVKSKIVQEEHIVRFLAGETMVKVLQKLPLMSTVEITVDDFDSDKVYNLRFEVDNWLGGGAYAKCKLTYVIETYVNKNATI